MDRAVARSGEAPGAEEAGVEIVGSHAGCEAAGADGDVVGAGAAPAVLIEGSGATLADAQDGAGAVERSSFEVVDADRTRVGAEGDVAVILLAAGEGKCSVSGQADVDHAAATLA